MVKVVLCARQVCRGRACPCPPLRKSGQGQALPLQSILSAVLMPDPTCSLALLHHYHYQELR
jgi:hypothetical protein